MIFIFRRFIKLFFPILFGITPIASFATDYALPPAGNALVGQIQHAKIESGDTTTRIASKFNVGLNALVSANPGTSERVLGAKSLVIPTAYILPPLPREGMVINLPEMRLYYYPAGRNQVMTFPIGIGKIGNTIPIRDAIVNRKTLNPTWIPGPAVRKYNAEQGIDLPKVMPAGPDNPLGPYAIYINIPSFLLHSTIFPESVGRRASFGCIRMHEDDIRDLYPIVNVGTRVLIVNMPNKVGWNGNKLYLEAHPPLEEHNPGTEATLSAMVTSIQQALPTNASVMVDWQLVAHLAQDPDGVPHEIGMRLN